jgi:hypothetical protein
MSPRERRTAISLRRASNSAMRPDSTWTSVSFARATADGGVKLALSRGDGRNGVPVVGVFVHRHFEALQLGGKRNQVAVALRKRIEPGAGNVGDLLLGGRRPLAFALGMLLSRSQSLLGDCLLDVCNLPPYDSGIVTVSERSG